MKNVEIARIFWRYFSRKMVFEEIKWSTHKKDRVTARPGISVFGGFEKF